MAYKRPQAPTPEPASFLGWHDRAGRTAPADLSDAVTEALLFVAGLLAITFGADWLVTGSSRVAARLGVSPLVVGLTVVAFGTSAPELFVSGLAALRGQAGLAVGNVMGSTVANVGLIAGLGALIRPIEVKRRLLVRESPLLILVLLIVMLLSWNDALGRLDGLALLAGFVIRAATFPSGLKRMRRLVRGRARARRRRSPLPAIGGSWRSSGSERSGAWRRYSWVPNGWSSPRSLSPLRSTSPRK